MTFFSAFKKTLQLMLAGLVMAGAAQAADQGTAAEAEAMVKKAVA